MDGSESLRQRPALAGDDGPRVAADVWHASLGGAVPLGSPTALPWTVVKLIDTPAEVRQPALLDDVVCLHGGGAKEVQRTRALRRTSHDVAPGALTVLPRGRGAQWRTRGPILYTHLVFSPKALDRVLATEFDRARDQLELADDVGLEDALLRQLLLGMVETARNGADRLRLYDEALFTATTLRLFGRCAAVDRAPAGAAIARGGLSGWRLRRVTDYLHAHRALDIGYDELTALTGLSRAQFFRAFKQSLGVSPGRYLEGIRLARAKRALERGAALDEASDRGGFASPAAMTRAFRRCMGVSPSGYRRWYR